MSNEDKTNEVQSAAVAVEPRERSLACMLAAGAVFALLTVAVSAITAAGVSILMQPQKNTSSGTWICVDSTGGHTAVGNPANCGPDDLVQWCTVWVVDNPADNSGHCAS